jgi:hypothetical protein
MDMANKSGKIMEQFISVNGKMTYLMDLENLSRLMVIFMKVNGIMAELMGEVRLYNSHNLGQKTVTLTKEIGLMVKNMEKESKHGQMVLPMTANIKMEKNTAKEHFFLLTALSTMVTFLRESQKE